MSITSALYSGVSGLNSNSKAMSVIGNNLANTNTLGFKGGRTIFSDLLSSNISGSGGTSQIGRGVNISKVDSVFSQGTFESTAINTDVAIEGEGFFILKEAGNDQSYYTRAGAFRFNSDGFLVNPEGYNVQGAYFDDAGQLIPGDFGDIQVKDVGLSPAQATNTLDLITNLDAASQTLPAFNYVNPAAPYDPVLNPIDSGTFNYSSSAQIFDSLGTAHLVSLYFRKDAGVWDVHWTAEDANGVSLNTDPAGSALADASGVPLVFSSEGKLMDINGATSEDPLFIPVTAAIPAMDFGNGSAPVNLTIDFDMTQFNSESDVISQGQNGFAAGNLTNVGINAEGVVVATYSNGEQTKIASLVLAKFNNPGGLEMVGSNMYTGTDASGAPRSGLPGPELGKIFTNSLEQSNVDMGQEFVKMITTQRGFEANSKIITVVDELLGQLINLKR
jgi:flagellar hook protein FlgE